MEKTKMSKKQFVIYMTVAFGLAWILEIIASIFSNNGNQMIFTSILVIAMFMPFLGVLIARIPLKGMLQHNGTNDHALLPHNQA